MKDELLDVIDKNNQVIDKKSKKECHQKGLLHRVIISEVISSNEKWVMVKQSSSRQDAGQYVSPVGGHVRAGESEVDALRREAMEELGISNFKYKYIGRAIFNRFVIGRQENHLFILYEIYTDQPPQLNHESESYKRYTINKLKSEIKQHPEHFGNAFHFVVNTFYQQLLL